MKHRNHTKSICLVIVSLLLPLWSRAENVLVGISHLNNYSQIYKINPANGQLVQQFNDAFQPRTFEVNGLAYGQGYLWGISHLNGYSQIYKINPANGQLVQQFNDAFQPRTFKVDSLAYGQGYLWGISHLNGYSQIYKINPANGQLVQQFNDAFQPRTFGVDAISFIENSAPSDLLLSSASTPENAISGAVVGTLSTTDPDAGNTFTYTLVSGSGSADNGSFTISGNSLRTAAMFDYETKSNYSVRIRTTDQDGLWYEKAFTITVSNVNETPTDIVLSNSTVAENQPAGTTVGTLSTTDPDEGNTFTYTLVSGSGSADNGSFTISGSTLQTAAPFNYEAKNTHSIRIRTTDQGGLWHERSLTVSVLDQQEQPFRVVALIFDSTSGCTIAWACEAGYSYQLQYSETLQAGDWHDLGPAQRWTSGTLTMTHTDMTAIGRNKKFYHIVRTALP